MQTQQHACPRCGAPIGGGKVACERCGLPLDTASISAFQQWLATQTRRRILRNLAGLMGVFAAIAAIYYLVSSLYETGEAAAFRNSAVQATQDYTMALWRAVMAVAMLAILGICLAVYIWKSPRV